METDDDSRSIPHRHPTAARWYPRLVLSAMAAFVFVWWIFGKRFPEWTGMEWTSDNLIVLLVLVAAIFVANWIGLRLGWVDLDPPKSPAEQTRRRRIEAIAVRKTGERRAIMFLLALSALPLWVYVVAPLVDSVTSSHGHDKDLTMRVAFIWMLAVLALALAMLKRLFTGRTPEERGLKLVARLKERVTLHDALPLVVAILILGLHSMFAESMAEAFGWSMNTKTMVALADVIAAIGAAVLAYRLTKPESGNES